MRVFGHALEGEPPTAVSNLTVARGPEDLRNATLSWTPAENSEGYVVRYGIAPDKLYNQHQVYGESVEIRTLTIGINYFFRVDSFNSEGITVGERIIGV